LIALFPTSLSNGFFQVSVKESIATVLGAGTAWFGKVIVGDGTNSVVVETAGTDSTSNTQNNLTVTSRLKVFNGTTWDRVRSAQTSVSSTFTGFLSVLPWSVYKVTPTTRTDGQGGALLSDDKGNLLVSKKTQMTTESSGSGTITTGGTAQQSLAADALGYRFSIFNHSNMNLYFSTLTTAVIGQPSEVVTPNSLYEIPYGKTATGALSIIGATTGQAFTVRKW
jgi:hypothetical protein